MLLLASAIHVNLRAFTGSDFPDETICNWKYGSGNSDTYIPREVKIWTQATQISFQTKNSDDFYDVQDNALIFSFDKALLGQITVKLFTPFNNSLTAHSYKIFPKIYHQKRNRCVKLGPCQASGCRVSFATRLTDCSEFQAIFHI